MNQPNMTIQALPYRFGAALLLLLVSACGASNVVIEGNFPTPNVNKMPLSVAVIYEDALREFAYMEYSETGREEINIESGQSHIRLFDAVLPAMFDRVVNVDTMEDAVEQ